PKFSHKGTFGHALICGGSKGKIGSVILASKASLRSGCGLVTAYVPKIGTQIIQTAFPEAMVDENGGESFLEEPLKNYSFNAIAFGIGAGTNTETASVLKNLIQEYKGKLIIDA